MFSSISTILYSILGTLALIAIIYLIFKYPQSRVYVFSFLGIVLIGLTAYSGINLHHYYNEQGGIFGYITGIFETNKLETEDLSFSLKNIEMIETSEGVYSAKVVDNKIVSSLEAGEEYAVFVNGKPCSQIETTTDYVTANYEYTFYDEDFKVLCQDTLYINFAFYNNGTYLSVSTKGGAEAMKYWNYYFQKESFVVDIKVADYKLKNEFVSGKYDKNNIVSVSYYIDGEKVYSQAYKKGAEIVLHECKLENFYCWSLTPKDEGITELLDLRCIEDLNLYAVFMTDTEILDSYNVSFKVDNEVVSSQVITKNSVPKTVVVNNTKYYDFVGWTLDGENVIDITNYAITENTEFVAKINYKNITLTSIEQEKWNTLCSNIYDPGADSNYYVGSTIISVEKLTNGINLLCKLADNGVNDRYWVAYFEGVEYRDLTDVFTNFDKSLQQCKSYTDSTKTSSVVKCRLSKSIDVSDSSKIDYINKTLNVETTKFT